MLDKNIPDIVPLYVISLLLWFGSPSRLYLLLQHSLSLLLRFLLAIAQVVLFIASGTEVLGSCHWTAIEWQLPITF